MAKCDKVQQLLDDWRDWIKEAKMEHPKTPERKQEILTVLICSQALEQALGEFENRGPRQHGYGALSRGHGETVAKVQAKEKAD